MPSKFLVALAAGALGFLASARAAEPVDLFPRGDLSAWEYVTVPAAPIATVCRAGADGVISVTGKPVGYLATRKSYDNYRLHAEWRWAADAPKNANGGVLLHIASGPKDRAWPVSIQVQTKIGRAGDLLPMAGAVFAEKLSTAAEAKTPQLNRRADRGEHPAGEWNQCDIVCQDGRISVTINGVLQNEVSEVTPGAGKVGFQLEGTAFELRNVRIEPL
ncbi:DUF1080 domain-containing protein [Opitutus sp. ER46]|uniref:3-keto-disaccharide hydrolase n=1 Tax=Opitutus sp. ER46 TaxID=2161864 RepID=UPI001304C729|nr:DUF1080 domain-containing protein [Opitutus sp. ER46]